MLTEKVAQLEEANSALEQFAEQQKEARSVAVGVVEAEAAALRSDLEAAKRQLDVGVQVEHI